MQCHQGALTSPLQGFSNQSRDMDITHGRLRGGGRRRKKKGRQTEREREKKKGREREREKKKVREREREEEDVMHMAATLQCKLFTRGWEIP